MHLFTPNNGIHQVGIALILVLDYVVEYLSDSSKDMNRGRGMALDTAAIQGCQGGRAWVTGWQGML